MVPGCLTGESEERETWTAESLRAAFRARKQFFKRGGRIETSAVDVSGQHYGRASGRREREQLCARMSAHEPKWDLVKRRRKRIASVRVAVRNVIGREKVLNPT
jgi:hypothetical protein